MKRHVRTCLLLVILAPAASFAFAEESPTSGQATRRPPLYCYPTPMAGADVASAAGVREHKGLFLRGTIGLGPSVTRDNNSSPSSSSSGFDGNQQSEYSGLAREWSLAVGGALNRSFVLYGEYANMRLLENDEQVEGLSLESSGLGLGVVYYLPQGGLFLSGSALLETLSVRVKEMALARRTLGVGFLVKVGMEIWALDQFALGGYVGVHRRSFGDDSRQDWTRTAGTAGLTAVFN